MKLVPLGPHLIVKQLEADETSEGGIILPDSAKERPGQGRVLSIGDGPLTSGGDRVPHTVHEGDRILFSQYTGTTVVIEGEELLILKESDVLAIVG
jgi:chaperonin GroES